MSLKVLWLCNLPLQRIAEDIGLQAMHLGGWMDGMANEIKSINGLDLIVVFPLPKAQSIVTGNVDGISYVGVPRQANPQICDTQTENYFKDIINTNNPDIIHIHGTEQPHSLAMINAAMNTGHLERTFISIQGLVSIYQKHYMGHLPYQECAKVTLAELVRKNSLAKQQERFVANGQFEIEAISKAKHVIGRTGWDKTCSMQINPGIAYHFCNENLREVFYQREWKLENCTRHSIFTSQASYPLKGFHLLLEAFAAVLKSFPDARLYVAGQTNTTNKSLLKKKFWNYQYPKYIDRLIGNYGLSDKIIYTGSLNASNMCDQYLKSHVFVLPSSIENSPNSLGEAMLLGVPCVASYVGGVMDLLEHKKEGLLFQSDAPYMMANHICEIFNNDNMVRAMAANARVRALTTHNKDVNAQVLYNIYTSVI